tara:strand:- start:46473 stop:46676 length:204 start_codon:yes stop_codon:yes gene_type:complete
MITQEGIKESTRDSVAKVAIKVEFPCGRHYNYWFELPEEVTVPVPNGELIVPVVGLGDETKATRSVV